MISSDTLLANPLDIQSEILQEFENRMDGASIVDANNSFTFLLETFSRIVSQAINAQDTKLNALYPRRATSTKELFNHLSDYDYEGFYSSPASLKMKLMLHRDYLVTNAKLAPGTNYKLVVIPKDTIFSVGRFKMGLYYPIHIRINDIVNSISAVYDTAEINPLHSLNSNMIQVTPVSYGGIDLISLEFDVFQFDKVVMTEVINASLGFIKKYKFTDKFYALRVFDVVSGKELSYTMSDAVYDIARPTARLKVYVESNEIELSIPQIYLVDGLISNQIKIELYTTQGALDVSISSIQLEDIKANFALSSFSNDNTYTTILRNIPTIIMTPSATRIVGGSSGYTFEQMKNFTIYHNGAITVPVTNLQLEQFFTDHGFRAYRKLDNLTDRRYYAYRKITDGDTELSVANGSLTINASELTENNDIRYQNNDSTIVILPTLIYVFDKYINKFVIMSNVEKAALLSKSHKQLAITLNEGRYFCNPHHFVLNTIDKYPTCNVYDLFTVGASNMTFVSDNIHISAQLSMTSVDIRHLGSGAGGYTIRIGIMRSEELKKTPDSDIAIYLSLQTTGGFRIGIRGTYAGTFNDVDAYDFSLGTNYKLSNNMITITNLINSSGVIMEHEVGLTGTMSIATFVKKTMFPEIPQDFDILARFVEDDDSWLSVSLQTFKYKLGVDISDVYDSNLLINWTGVQCEKYLDDELLRYAHDMYELNPDGTLKYTKSVDGELILNKLHSKDDVVEDDSGNDVISHYKGSFKQDGFGNTTQTTSRTKDFTFDISGYDYRHTVVTTDFLINLSNTLSAYYDTVRSMQPNILENTRNYLKPVMTAGDAKYKLNNFTTIISDLELSFEINVYVSQVVSEDASLLDMLKTKIVSIIKTNLVDSLISTNTIMSEVKRILSDYVSSIDIVSTNGYSDIQTLVISETDKSPRLGTYIDLGSDNRLAFYPKVTIDFKPLDY